MSCLSHPHFFYTSQESSKIVEFQRHKFQPQSLMKNKSENGSIRSMECEVFSFQPLDFPQIHKMAKKGVQHYCFYGHDPVIEGLWSLGSWLRNYIQCITEKHCLKYHRVASYTSFYEKDKMLSLFQKHSGCLWIFIWYNKIRSYDFTHYWEFKIKKKYTKQDVNTCFLYMKQNEYLTKTYQVKVSKICQDIKPY